MAEQPALVWIVDDDDQVRSAVSAILKHASLETREFDRGLSFLREFDSARHGCAVFDLRLPDLSGLELLETLRRQGHETPVIFLSGYGDIATATHAMRLGAIDFIEKRKASETLLPRVREALAIDRRRRSSRDEIGDLLRRHESLTPRERELLELVVAGRLSKEIASLLRISERTVANHRASLIQKMGAVNTADLVRMAVRVRERRGSKSSPP